MDHGIQEYVPARPEPLLTIDELSRLLKIGRSSVYRMIREGELEPIRVGKRMRFRAADVDAYLKRGTS